MRTRSSLGLVLLLSAGLVGGRAVAGPPPAAPAAPAVRGYGGFHVEPLSILPPAHRAELGASVATGNVVAFVMPDGPAAAAGLRVGDLLVSWAGRPVPVTTTTDRYTDEHRSWRATLRGLQDALVAGQPVELGVLRAGEPVTLRLAPADEAQMHRAMGGDDRPVPSPADAGPPVAFRETFDALAADAPLPSGFHPWEGRWRVVADAGATGLGLVLRQDRPVLPWAVLLVTGAGRAVADGRVKVRFEPVSGVVDASAGVVFRAQDAKNYYVVRANALEDNWNLYVVKAGVRTAIAETRVTPPSRGSWHAMDVTFSGDRIRAVLDGKDVVEGRDATWTSGWCGLWTKADSVTLFDDLEVEPAAAK